MSTEALSQPVVAEPFCREELWSLRTRALARIHPEMNQGWARAYQRLADAADILDAFFGRSSVAVCSTCFRELVTAESKPPDEVPEATP